MRILLHLFVIGIVCSCSRNSSSPTPPGYSKHSGDFISFFSDAVTKFGGRTNGGTTTRFDSEWWFKTDTNGFQILMATNYRTRVESSLREVFGEPIVSAGYPHLLTTRLKLMRAGKFVGLIVFAALAVFGVIMFRQICRASDYSAHAALAAEIQSNLVFVSYKRESISSRSR